VTPKKYIVRQPGRDDVEFDLTRDAVEHLINNPGYAQLYYDDELVMTKGFEPTDDKAAAA
jgi:hypothetical protein